jgi:hypothetical protein
MICIAGNFKFANGVSDGSCLLFVNGGEMEMHDLKFLHGGASKGAFINVSGSGVAVVNSSQITVDMLVRCVN